MKWLSNELCRRPGKPDDSAVAELARGACEALWKQLAASGPGYTPPPVRQIRP